MGQIFKIIRESTKIEELLKTLTKNKNDIKDILCIIRLRNGDMNIVDNGVPFETLCSGSKMLDFRITQDLMLENSEFEIEEEDEERDS